MFYTAHSSHLLWFLKSNADIMQFPQGLKLQIAGESYNDMFVKYF